MKYIGIDYGSKRTGVAVSDETGHFAFPKKVFVTSGRLAGDVALCVKEFAAKAIVLGESRDYSGAPNKIMKDILSFKKELEGLTRLPVYLEAEFMTSMQAERLQKDLGGTKEGMLDAGAAAFILQSFLDKKNLDQNNTVL